MSPVVIWEAGRNATVAYPLPVRVVTKEIPPNTRRDQGFGGFFRRRHPDSNWGWLDKTPAKTGVWSKNADNLPTTYLPETARWVSVQDWVTRPR